MLQGHDRTASRMHQGLAGFEVDRVESPKAHISQKEEGRRVIQDCLIAHRYVWMHVDTCMVSDDHVCACVRIPCIPLATLRLHVIINACILHYMFHRMDRMSMYSLG